MHNMQKAYSFLLRSTFITFLILFLGYAGGLNAQEQQAPFVFDQDHYTINIPLGGREKLTVSTTNGQAFTPESRPTINYTSFKLNEAGDPILSVAGDESKWFAGDWIAGPEGLINLEDDKENNLDLIITVPDTAEVGAYRGAIAVSHDDWTDMAASWIIINVGIDTNDPAFSFVDSDDTFLDFATGDVSLGIVNQAKHYLDPKVTLVLSANEGGDQQRVELSSGNEIGLLPGEQQVFLPVDGETVFSDEILEADDMVVRVVFEIADQEVSRSELPSSFITGLPEDESKNDQDVGDDQDEQQTDSDDVASNSTNTPTETSNNTISKYIDFIVIGGTLTVVLLLALLLWLTVRNRSMRMPPGSQYQPQVTGKDGSQDNATKPITSVAPQETGTSPADKISLSVSAANQPAGALPSDNADPTSSQSPPNSYVPLSSDGLAANEQAALNQSPAVSPSNSVGIPATPQTSGQAGVTLPEVPHSDTPPPDINTGAPATPQSPGTQPDVKESNTDVIQP